MGVATLVAAQLALLTPAAGATSSFTFTRMAGADRFATAAQIATSSFPSGASTVLLATGTTFPDALAGNFLAGNLEAPILLTNPTGALPATTSQALTALHATKVVILGGTAAVSAGQQQALQASGLQVTRISGSDRFQTMAMIAQYPGTTVGRDQAGVPTAILATGDTFPDALAAGPLAYAAKLPIILTDGSATTLSAAAAQAITALHIGNVLLVGGDGAVSPAISQQLTSMSITVTRLAGPDRSATSLALAQEEVTQWGFSTAGLAVARGDDFADALAGGGAAGAHKEPLLVTPSPTDAGAVATYAADYATTLSAGLAFGGPAALTDPTLTAIASSAGAPTAQGSSPPPSSGPPSGSGAPPPTYPPPPQPAGSPFPNGGVGYDISWPECPGAAFPTGTRQFAIVGVNDGHAYSINPCLQAQAAWAGPSLSLYININVPFAGWDPNETNHLMQGPEAACAKQGDLSCQFYDYGYNAAISSMADAALYNISASTWWLDVEDPGGLWSSSTADNVKLIAGAIDSLRNAGHTAAVYSTPYQWGLITGAYQPGIPTWVATGGDPSNLADWCGASHSFGGGATWMVQYGQGTFDGDYSC